MKTIFESTYFESDAADAHYASVAVAGGYSAEKLAAAAAAELSASVLVPMGEFWTWRATSEGEAGAWDPPGGMYGAEVEGEFRPPGARGFILRIRPALLARGASAYARFPTGAVEQLRWTSAPAMQIRKGTEERDGRILAAAVAETVSAAIDFHAYAAAAKRALADRSGLRERRYSRRGVDRGYDEKMFMDGLASAMGRMLMPAGEHWEWTVVETSPGRMYALGGRTDGGYPLSYPRINLILMPMERLIKVRFMEHPSKWTVTRNFEVSEMQLVAGYEKSDAELAAASVFPAVWELLEGG